MNTAPDVLRALGDPSIVFTQDELSTAYNTLRWRLDRMNKTDLATFSVGDTVEFDHGGRTITGVVERVNLKTVSLREGEYKRWRVAPSFLRKTTPEGG